MIFTPTQLQDAVIIHVEHRGDERGFSPACSANRVCRARAREPVRAGGTIHTTRRDTLRGLHFQEVPHREVKLVRCTAVQHTW